MRDAAMTGPAGNRRDDPSAEPPGNRAGRERMTTTRFANIVLAAAAMVTGAVALASLIQLGLPGDVWPFLVLVVVPALAATLLVLALVLARPTTRLNLALMTGVIAVMLPVAELILTAIPSGAVWAIQRAAPADGAPAPQIDERGRVEVVQELRTSEPDAYLSLVANVLRGEPVGRRVPFSNGQRFRLAINGRGIVPLTNVSRKTTVYCNEGGQYSIFRSDERGFNNPEGVWDRPVDVALIGDSFVQGACVPPDATMAAFLRDRSVAALTAGIDDFGPLSELAVLREYVAPLRPKHVVWVYYEGNDFRNLEDEKNSDMLRRYLEPGFTQGLAALQSQIDSALMQFIDHNIDIELERIRSGEPPAGSISRPSFAELLVRGLTLRSLRQTFGVADIGVQQSHCCDIALFETVLRQAKSSVESWGGTFTFVYVPSGARYYMKIVALTHEPEMRARGRVLDMVRRVGVPIIDLHEILTQNGDPRRFYFHNRSHFDPAGYQAAADAIFEHLGLPATAPRPRP
jgi:hypothetical protein